MTDLSNDVRRTQEEHLRTQIHEIETHLKTIVADDDCAYEKARLRVYETMLEDHRRRLDALRIAA